MTQDQIEHIRRWLQAARPPDVPGLPHAETDDEILFDAIVAQQTIVEALQKRVEALEGHWAAVAEKLIQAKKAG